MKLTVSEASSKYARLAHVSKQANNIQKSMCDDLDQMETNGDKFAYIMEIQHLIKKVESSLY